MLRVMKKNSSIGGTDARVVKVVRKVDMILITRHIMISLMRCTRNLK